MGSDISAECNEYRIISDSEAPLWLYSSIYIAFITVCEPVVLSIGVVSNWTFLFVFACVPTMRTSTNVFLTNLALADLLFLSLHATYTLWRYSISPGVFTYLFADSPGCCIFFSLCSRLDIPHQLCWLPWLCMRNIQHYPMEHLQKRGSRQVAKLALFCWLVGLVIACIISPEVCLFHKLCLQ